MKLKQIEIENFRCFERLRVPLEDDVTAVIGVNGAGKTALLDAIALSLVPLLEATPLHLPRTHLKGPDERESVVGIRLLPDDLPVAAVTAANEASPGRRLRLAVTASAAGDASSTLEWAFEREFIYSSDALADSVRDFRWEGPPGMGPAPGGLGLYVPAQEDGDGGGHFRLPAMAYYGDERICSRGRPPVVGELAELAKAAAAFFRAFDAGADLRAAEDWFIGRENLELREGRKQGRAGLELPELAAIRRALTGMLNGIERVYTDGDPPSLKAEKPDGAGGFITLELRQLSAGQRNLLALTLDFARRLSLAHPGWDEPLQAPGILIIDEIELNLHPRWQQTVVPHLRGVFPNTQIIVATHSASVLSTLHERQIRFLRDGQLFRPGVETYGADSARVQRLVQDTDSRPPADQNAFVERLNAVFAAIADGRLADAGQELARLEAERGVDDPDLADARMQIDNRKWEAELGL